MRWTGIWALVLVAALLRTKAVLHARAELLYCDPNLAYELASRMAKLEPHSSA